MAQGHKLTSSTDAEGAVTTTSDAVGGFNVIFEPVTTAFDPNVSLIGTAKYVQLGLAALLGNMIGVKAKTDSWGVAVTEKLSFTLGE